MSAEPLASPFEAFKLARLVEERGRLRFAPLHRRDASAGYYDASAHAVCEEGRDHDPPVFECTCGFHGVGSADELWRLGWVEHATLVLRVQFSGRVVVHRHGMRAGRQDVLEVDLSDRCHRCGASAVCVGSFSRRAPIAPCCDRCARARRYSLAQVSEDLGVPVRLRSYAPGPVSLRLRSQVLLVQLFPPILLAVLGIVLGVVWHPALPGICGLLAVGWLAPGRVFAEGLLARREISSAERHRLLGFRGGAVLLVTMLCWAVAGFVGGVLSGGF